MCYNTKDANNVTESALSEGCPPPMGYRQNGRESAAGGTFGTTYTLEEIDRNGEDRWH
jgi:hypothetical protein